MLLKAYINKNSKNKERKQITKLINETEKSYLNILKSIENTFIAQIQQIETKIQ